jgi:DNA (cytosine-5)-methyltransferase 1
LSNFVSLFAGAGGLDLGLELGGWSCLYATDIDAKAVETLSRNRGLKLGRRRAMSDTIVERNDVSFLTGDAILSKAGKRRGDIALLAGGPPCQSWSSAGHQLGFDDPRGRLFEDYVRIAASLDARWLVFENVRGLLTARGKDGEPGSALEQIRMALLKAGWETHIDLLNAANYGVPQRRVRLIILGYRAGDEPQLPSPTHTLDNDSMLEKWVTLRDALRSLPAPAPDEIIRPGEKLLAELSLLPPGCGVKSPGKKETTRPGGHWGYKQGAFLADPDRPARTVTASGQQDWIMDERLGIRRLTPRECAALQSFPGDWQFEGSRADKYRLIGNAVPPKLAQKIGESLLGSGKRTTHAAASQSQPGSPRPMPLPIHLQAAIEYTRRDSARNGESRRAAGTRRPARAAV